MSFTTRTKINKTKINNINKKANTILLATSQVVLTDIKNSGLMPFKTGNLQNENTFIDEKELRKGKVSIVSSTAYARRLYYHPEFNFSKANNSRAGADWFNIWLKENPTLAYDTFLILLNKSGGIR